MGSDSTHSADDATGTAPGTIGFRPIQPADKPVLMEIAAEIWEGHDYLPHVFDRWVADTSNYFVGMTLADRLIGCGRLKPLDGRRGWLEGLRIRKRYQGRGLGRTMSRHMVAAGRDRGYEQLVFSTYFGNLSSIRINEAFGFRRTAAFTNLDLELKKLPSAPALAEIAPEVEVAPGYPENDQMMANDWTFLPPDLPDRRRHFPNAETVSRGDCRIVVAENTKYAGVGLDICWIEAPSGLADPVCLRYAIAKAHGLGRRFAHVMVPPALSLKPFLEVGFYYYEQPCDVYLYAADAAKLKL